jgi:serine/threonine protein kinase
MKKNDKNVDNEETTALLLSKLSQLSHSPSSSDESCVSDLVNVKSVCKQEGGQEWGGKGEVINTLLACPTSSLDEIVSIIVKHVQEADIYQLTYWDNMRKFMLKHTIANIHNHNENEYLKDLIVYKQYDACNVNSIGALKYGMFKHKCFNLMFRIDESDDQFSGENIVSSTLMHKYRNKYQDIIRLGIVIPVYCHIKLSIPQLFYSVQPCITNSITFDRWIKSIKHKGNFDEMVYDALIQLCAILKELHDVDCVHGDIKPANILVVPNKTQVSIFLIDFGLSGIHEKTITATGGTIPFCAPETYNTNANTRNGNNVIKHPQHFEYNWVKHKKSHDVWSLGFIFMTVYIFKHISLYYDEYPIDFFLPSGYVSPNYLRMVKHEYIRDIFSEHILVEPSKRCDILKLNDLISNLSFM